MSLRVYSTLTKTKEPFVPVTPGQVGIYLCGPTVYKPSHIGHMVGPVIFDVIKRYLRYEGFKVTLVVNITDVDDKLIVESQKRGLTMQAVAEEMTADYMRNLATMGIDTIDHFPKATDHIGEILRFTQELIEKGFAYAADGDVYFDVGKDPEYGKLCGQTVDQMKGEGGGTADRKRSSFDFALWKGAKPGEPQWDSPWGPGRPGWHIECSAMSRVLLGKTFDIHGGGLDLRFPHHENEVAQSECCHGVPQARYWCHNGLVQAADEVGKVGGRNTRANEDIGDAEIQQQIEGKEGKSKGAGPFTDLLAKFPAEAIRFFLLSTQYRRPIYFGDEPIKERIEALEGFYRYFVRYERTTGESFYALPAARNREAGARDPGGDAFLLEVKSHRDAFLEAMDDDFNSGGAIGSLFQLLPVLNRYIVSEGLEGTDKPADKLAKLKQGTETLRELTSILGLFREPVKPAAAGGELAGKLVELLIDLRQASRAAKDYATGDTIRKSLGELSIALEDRAGKTEWSVKDPGEGLAEKLVALIVNVRKSVRAAKNFALSDKLRDQLAGVGVVLEDHAGETSWTIKA